MKKIFCILAAVIAAASLTVGAYAEEIVTEQTYTDTIDETIEETVEETATEGENETEEETETEAAIGLPDELTELLGASTPEQVEHVKEYLLYGLSTLPLSERVKLAVVAHIDAVAWGVVCLAFVVMGILYVRSNKKTIDENKTMNDNAIDLYEQGVERSEAAAKITEEAEQRIKAITDGACSAMEVLTKNSNDILHDAAAEMIQKISDLAAENSETMAKVYNRDTGLTEAIMTLNNVVVQLINLSDLPEAERDAVMAEFLAADKRIKEVTGDDSKED